MLDSSPKLFYINIPPTPPFLIPFFAFTALPNQPSQRVMQKIGLTHIKDFNHPLVDPNHPLCRHTLYEKQKNSTSTQTTH